MPGPSFRDKKCGFRCPAASRTVQQLFCFLFILGTSFSVLFIVMNSDDQSVCDYTGMIDTCDDQPFYRTQLEKNNSLLAFDYLWFVKAQELRNETEELKCKREKKLMEDLTKYHHAQAKEIIRKCHAAFQQCVEDLRKEKSWTTTTSTTVTTTTQFTYEVVTTRDQRGNCQKRADGSPMPDSEYLDCITGVQAGSAAAGAAGLSTGLIEPKDCSLCDSFCRAFNWTQADPDYATAMNFTLDPAKWSCGPKVCPWIPECGSGMNVHRNCSAKGCPCRRALCGGSTTTTTTTTTMRVGGRRLEGDEPAATTTTTITEKGIVYVAMTTTTTYESLENNTNCTCKPGPVDIILVGRPFKVFFGNPATMIRRRRGGGTGRRLDERSEEEPEFERGSTNSNYPEEEPEFEEEEADYEAASDAEKRFLQVAHLYQSDANANVELLQGVHVDMEEEIIIGRDREFNCRRYFSDRYKYVYPRTVGDMHSFKAMLARDGHPDLGCGYSGDFKVTCGPEILTDNETGQVTDTGNCSYKVDISTCRPPTYTQAVTSCYKDETWSAGETIMPDITDFLDVEDLNITVGDPVEAHEIPGFNRRQCCEVHVGSECVVDHNYTGTVDGIWSPEKSYLRETGYFPKVDCDNQGKLRHRACPRVKIKKISRAADTSILRPCRKACNLTYARQELENLCVDTMADTPSGGTYDRELKALRDKINLMQTKRDELESWAREQWPLVGHTEQIFDCIEDLPSRRYNMMGWKGSQDGFENLKQRYECRMHGCKPNQCVKVRQLCPIPQMSSAPESTCGPFGDQSTYSCHDKLYFNTWGTVSRPVGYGWLALSIVCFLASFATCFEENCMKKKSRVVPYREAITDEAEEVKRCDKCGDALDNDALDESSYTCTKCMMRANMPEACRNCGQEFEDPEDEFCANCRQPRAMAAITDGGEQLCMRCGEFMDLQDAKCLECGWHPEDAIVLKADCGPLRATANTASNDRRIVPANVHFAGNMHGLE